ncbi:hypothetical protein DEO23_15800 [Brachybacterium endophyticum]|uniref:Uncharacterized protein n=1 Tax=Brachybacterium endophyticum TaxID=2182385 RepID=A0A2U2RGE6_9MICO|nr:hypothetical protein [Brachybacterium endophyticum]PWH04934.1 hypothetical protein DEO23_15800 [Brachybacterium endophyticum]
MDREQLKVIIRDTIRQRGDGPTGRAEDDFDVDAIAEELFAASDDESMLDVDSEDFMRIIATHRRS